MGSTVFRLSRLNLVLTVFGQVQCVQSAKRFFQKNSHWTLKVRQLNLMPCMLFWWRADLPYKNPEEKEDLELDLDLVEEESSGEEYEEYQSQWTALQNFILLVPLKRHATNCVLKLVSFIR